VTILYFILNNDLNASWNFLFFLTRQKVFSNSSIFNFNLSSVSEKNVKMIHVLSKENNGLDEHGYMDEEKIKKYVPDYLERDFYICGPKPMLKIVTKALKKLGIQKSKIYFEKFTLG